MENLIQPIPRETLQIVVDLLQRIVDTEWSDQIPCTKGCCADPGCEDCRELIPYNTNVIYGHKNDCRKFQLIEKTRAFLRCENILLKEKDLEEIDIP